MSGVNVRRFLNTLRWRLASSCLVLFLFATFLGAVPGHIIVVSLDGVCFAQGETHAIRSLEGAAAQARPDLSAPDNAPPSNTVPDIAAKSSPDQPLLFKDPSGRERWKFVCRTLQFKGLFSPEGTRIVFSPNLQRVAYTCSSQPGERWPDRVVLDDQEGKKYGQVGAIEFSPDSNRVAYEVFNAAKKSHIPDSYWLDELEGKGKYFVVLDGLEGPQYDYIILRKIFSPDSTHFAYTTMKEFEDRFRAVYVLDGHEFPRLFGSNTFNLEYSPDSQRLAFVGEEGGKSILLLDGKQIFTADEFHDLRFSPDSKTLAYTYRLDRYPNREWFFAYGQDTYGPYDEAYVSYCAISPDSKRVAVPFLKGEEWFLTFEHKVYGPSTSNSIPEARFSPDSKSVALFTGREKKTVVRLNNKVVGEFDMARGRFSPDSKHFAFVGYNESPKGRGFLIADGKSIAEGDWMGDITYSPDSQRLACILGQDDKWVVWDEGREGRPYDFVSTPRFSPDSSHLAYWATRGEQSILVLDGVEKLSFTGRSEPKLLFTPENRLYAAGVGFDPELDHKIGAARARARLEFEVGEASPEQLLQYSASIRLMLFCFRPQ